MGYFDENAQTWVTIMKITDSDGNAVFQVPVDDSGDSFPFAFSGSDIELARLYADISGGKWSAFVIPASQPQAGVMLEMDPIRLAFRIIQGRVDVKVFR